MFSLICVRINGWVNNGEAGDLRRYRGHYDVIVMIGKETYGNHVDKTRMSADIDNLVIIFEFSQCRDMIWYDIYYMTWYDMMRYDIYDKAMFVIIW